MTTQTAGDAIETTPPDPNAAPSGDLLAMAEQDLEAALARLEGRQSSPATGQQQPPPTTTDGTQATTAEPAPETPPTDTPPTDPPPATEPPPVGQQVDVAEYRRLQQESIQHRHQAQAAQDAQYATQFAEDWRNARVREGWDEQQAAAAATTLRDSYAQGAQAYRSQQGIVEAAFMAGQESDLSLDQVRELASSANVEAFRTTLHRLTSSAPTARERELEQQLKEQTEKVETLSSEFAELKKQVVPSGQRFGDIAGTGAPETQQNQGPTPTEILDGAWDQPESYWTDLDKRIGIQGA